MVVYESEWNDEAAERSDRDLLAFDGELGADEDGALLELAGGRSLWEASMELVPLEDEAQPSNT